MAAPGRVYTPAPLAARVVRRVLRPLVRGRSREEILGLRVCDPACGEGVFLLEACRFLGEHVGSRRRAVACLMGVDTDAAALARARARLRRFAGAAPPLVRADALRFAWGERRFDAVIGNPPWISYSGRHAETLPAADRDDYAARFTTFAGWPSLHALFVELAVELSRGRIGLLLPAQVGDLDGYAPLRAFVRRHCRLDGEPADFGEDGFPGITQPCCGLFLVRAAAGSEGGAAPFWPRDVEAAALLERLEALPRPPPEAFGDIGVHTGNCARKLLRDGGVPIREGKDVFAFRLRAARRTLREAVPRAPGDYFRIGSLDRFRAVPILLRQTALRPIAALHESPTYFRNSVLACRGLPGLPDEVAVAWLNASVVGWFHRRTVREANQRAFPQLKLKHLRNLPLPDGEPPPDVRALARVVAYGERLDAEPELDAAVSRWLGLDAELHARVRAIRAG